MQLIPANIPDEYWRFGGMGTWVHKFVWSGYRQNYEEAVLTIHEDSDMFVCQTNKGSIWKK